ncbi:tail fiber protein [Escherichia phage vB_EcoP_WFI101126]|uniref:Pectate lyase superfamily protein n=1 Tax=Escherichia phage vB_EcoP_WFI101126 TaxID=2508203 RepID=A0A482MTH6_9CAUD|nr:tail fiber protein [Escherichia phage vB_EcoP_WFI101126]QBQ76440.1 pectate lyase superfamily protein [Escherichia phage vB_EcoP_WFI101126]
MISYNNSAPNAVNNVGQFGATEGSIGAYKSAAEYASDSKYWAMLSQKNYNNIGEILKEVERLYAEGNLLKEDIEQLKSDFENQNQILLGLIQQTGEAIDNTNTAIGEANAATDRANQAVQDVLAQLDKISNMSVVATTLPPGTPATGSFDNSTGVFSFGIPEGQPGKDGKDGTDGTISDIGDVAISTPVSDDYGFFVDKDDGGLYRTPMSEIAKLVPAVTSFNGRTGPVVPAAGDYTVSQVTGAAASGVNNDINQIRGLTTALSVAQGGTGAKNADDARTNLSAMLDSKTGLDGTTNLNDLNGLKAGFYYQPASANAKPELNYPTQLAGSLVVVKTGAGTGYSCKQVYSLYNNPNVTYSRVLNASAGPTSPWSEWVRHVALSRVEEGSSATYMYSSYAPDAPRLQVWTSGLWGCHNGTNWVPLSLAQGGTGATSAAGARAILNLDRFVATASETQMLSSSGDKKVFINSNNNTWGCYDITNSRFIPLGINQGGTGATTADAARMSLVAAKSGANSDITSMTNVVNFTQSPTIPDAVSSNEPVALGQLSTETAALDTKITEAKDAAAAANTNANSRVLTSQLSDTSEVAQGDALVGVMAPFTGATARTQHDKNLDVISIADFGGGTNWSDNGPALQRAITYAASASGNNRGMVYIPPGVWNFTSGVTVPGNVSIKGAGVGSTQLKINSANLVLFDVGNGTNNPNNVSISDLHVLVSSTCTANPLFRFRNGYNCGIDNIRVDGPWYDLIHFRGGAAQFVYRVSDSILNGTSASRHTITIGESSSDGVVQDVFLTNLVLGGRTTGYGVYEKYSSGVYATNVDSLNVNVGWAWEPATGCYCKGSFYTAILGDTNSTAGLRIRPQAGTTVNDLTFNGCWVSSAGSNSSHHGLIIDSSAGTVANISFNGLTAVNNKGHGVYINGSTTGYGYEFTNLSVSNNSQAGASLCSGMKIVAGSSHINISNGHAGGTLGLGTNNQAYGIDVEAGTGNSIKIVNMEMHNNKLGAMNFGATGPYNRIEGCSPFRTRMKGAVELKNGTSSITVNPGLNRPFGGADVQVTPTTDLGALRYWVTQSGNSFTINTNANVSGGQWFSWAVDASYS